MCQAKMLSHNDYGYINQCHRCGSSSLVFGNLLLRLSQKDYSALLHSISHQVENGADCPDPELPMFICRTHSEKVRMRFTYHQLCALEQLMQEAQVEMQLRELLLVEEGNEDQDC